MPKSPPALVGMGAGECPPLARVAQRLGLSLAQVDATMTVDEVLDECDLQIYLHDCDREPMEAPKPSPRPSRR
jgi:hypothetical protein